MDGRTFVTFALVAMAVKFVGVISSAYAWHLLLIGQRFGLDPGVMTDVLNAATGMNNSTQKKFRQFVLSRKFNAGFTMGLLAKDLSIAMQVGRETGTPAPISALVNELIVSAQTAFGPGSDHTEMAKLLERLAGDELKSD